MLSSATLRAQIASVIEVLSKAAVAEISKVVEDGMVVLRLEVCQRENEIKKLKSNIELLHGELRAAHHTVSQRSNPHRGRDESQGCVGDERNLLERVHTDQVDNSPPVPEVQVKHEPVEEGSEESTRRTGTLGENVALYEGDQWQSTTQKNTEGKSLDFLTLGQNSLSCLLESPLDSGLSASCNSSGELQQSPFSRGMMGYSLHRNNTAYNAVRRRTMKRLFKKGFFCPYCGKCFGSIGHLERHKRIHTGEKPYPCEICGRRFNQKCTVKEHMKIHMRGIEPRHVDFQSGEKKQITEVNHCINTSLPEKESQAKPHDDLPKNESPLQTPVQIKSEPEAENVTQPLFHGGNEQKMKGPNRFCESFTFEREPHSQQWMSRSQNNAELNNNEFPSSSTQNEPSFPGITHLLPPADQASCSTFSFPGNTYGELKNNMIAQTPYGSSDSLMMSDEANMHNMEEASMNHRRQRRSWSFQGIKPKKSFVCSFCSKVFERSGHLSRHLRIHTGEKPYGCQICGRCFNQKSSLKGHMKTHRKDETTDALQAGQLMFPMSDNQLYGTLVEPNDGPEALEEQFPGPAYSKTAGEEIVTVKLEPNEESFPTASQVEIDTRGGEMDQRLLWVSEAEKSKNTLEQTVCVRLQDVKCHLSPAAAGTSDKLGYMSPSKKQDFTDSKENEQMMKKHQFSVREKQPGGSNLTLAPGPHGEHIASDLVVSDYRSVSERTHEGGVFEFNRTPAGDPEDNCSSDATMPNTYICSSCGQSFDSFDIFQRHPCERLAEQSLSCEICGKTFPQMSFLKLHLKLHAGKVQL